MSTESATAWPESPLLRAAQQALLEGDWRGGAQQLEKAASIAREDRRLDDAARCLQMATSLHRLTGDVGEALRISARIDASEGASVRARFAAAAERGEALLDDGDAAAAAVQWRTADALADELGLPRVARAAVTRRLALCEARSGNRSAAWRLFDAAGAAHRAAQDPLGAAWVALEHANCALEVGDSAAAKTAVATARGAADSLPAGGAIAEDAVAHLRSELALAQARMSAAEGNLRAAEASALAARELALEAVSPVSYLAAAALLSFYADLREDRLAAYTVLATAWVTLGDVLGGELSQAWVRPLLEVYRGKWGDAEFDRVKGQHDRQRRARQAGAS